MNNIDKYDNNVSIILDLLLVNPAGFWGAMMDEMVGYMSGRGEVLNSFGEAGLNGALTFLGPKNVWIVEGLSGDPAPHHQRHFMSMN